MYTSVDVEQNKPKVPDLQDMVKKNYIEDMMSEKLANSIQQSQLLKKINHIYFE